MRSRLFSYDHPRAPSALLAVVALALAPAVQATPGSLRDFRLPSDRDPPQNEPAPQGPVAPDVPASTNVLRPTPTPTPSPTPVPSASAAAVQPAPVPTTAPPVVLPKVSPPAPDQRRDPAPPPQTQAPAPAATPAPSPVPQAEESTSAGPLAPPQASPLPLPSSPAAVTAGREEGGLPWLWIAVALLTLAALAAAAWLLRRRAGGRSASAVPQIERPTLAPVQPAVPATEPRPESQPAPASTAAAEPTDRSGLDVELEPLRLSLTLMNAALSYRLLVNNFGEESLENLSIVADMIAAHANLSREQQLSGPDANALQVASIERLEQGESRIVSGEFRLPFSQIMPIRQGNATLLFPLARFRIEGAARQPVTRTFLVAQPPERPGAGLQPFRLDLGPRIYPKLAQRAFA